MIKTGLNLIALLYDDGLDLYFLLIYLDLPVNVKITWTRNQFSSTHFFFYFSLKFWVLILFGCACGLTWMWFIFISMTFVPFFLLFYSSTNHHRLPKPDKNEVWWDEIWWILLHDHLMLQIKVIIHSNLKYKYSRMREK